MKSDTEVNDMNPISPTDQSVPLRPNQPAAAKSTKLLSRLRSLTIVLSVILVGSCGVPSEAWAVDVLATAMVGQPYGVASVELPIGVPAVGQEYPPIEVTDTAGRVLFSASNDVRVELGLPSDRPLPPPGGGRLLGRVGELVRELAGEPEPTTQTVARRVCFLFVGSKPLRITLGDVEGTIGTYDIVPQVDPAGHARLLQQWWDGFTEAARLQTESADYPTVVESYLVAMLAARTGMPLPQWYFDTEQSSDQLLDTLKLIAGAEGIDGAIFRQAAVGGAASLSPAELPVPSPPAWIPANIPGDRSDVAVEPLAERVPPECFYIRYGSFNNFLWFRDLSAEHGGDITRMLTLRGIDHNGMLKIEDQLAMKMTQMARMLGGTVIEDQAVIGRDLFFVDGASIGVLIRSANMMLLQTATNADRAKVANSDQEVKLKNIKIGDRDVSLLSTADHRIRSFLVVDGQYMLVANSRSIVERFLEVGKSGESLAATDSFRLARGLMPLQRDDTIFAYFSPQMLQGLVSPEYLIELRRRLYAKADITMVHLARRAAALELGANGPNDALGIDQLAQAGFLPQSFGARADGSGTFTVGTAVVDTLRGARGSFLPIADVDVETVTAEESAWYETVARDYGGRFPNLDPIMVGVRRDVVEDQPGRERVTVHAQIAPWDPGKYGTIAEQLGPPTTTVMTFPPDDIVTVQAHVASALLGPPTHLFVGIKDSLPPKPEDFDGILGTYFSLRQIPGYLGAWPQPGALDRLPLGLGRGQPAGPGMMRLIGGVYRFTDGQFSVVSFQPDILQASLQHLAAGEATDSAQVRVHVGDLNGSLLHDWVNALLYERTRETSLGGANYLSMLSNQLRIEPDAVMAAAKEILAAKMQCTLGGSYQPSKTLPGRWVSTAWGSEIPPETPPPGYVAPLMSWFRGADAALTQYDDRVVADMVVEMARK